MKHCAYNIITGEIMTCNRGNQFKRAAAHATKLNSEWCGVKSVWRFCHDYGKKWLKNGFPQF